MNNFDSKIYDFLTFACVIFGAIAFGISIFLNIVSWNKLFYHDNIRYEITKDDIHKHVTDSNTAIIIIDHGDTLFYNLNPNTKLDSHLE